MSSAAKVGLFALVVFALVGFFIMRIEDLQFGDKSESKEIRAIFDSVAGLDEKAPVRIAGVRVGKVEKIELRDGRALVTLKVRDDVELHRGAHAGVANLGMLGDKYVELFPGDARMPEIPQDTVLTGATPAGFDEVMGKIAAIGDDVKAITASIRQANEGGAPSDRIGHIVVNVERLSHELRLLVEANAANVNATTANFAAFSAVLREQVPAMAAQVRELVSGLDAVVAENRVNTRESIANLRTLSEKLQVSADNINAITGKIAGGEGSLGKLVNRDEAHDKLVEALDSVKGGVGKLTAAMERAEGLDLRLGMRGELLPQTDDGRGVFSVRLTPKDSKHFYDIELSASALGRRTRREEIITTTDEAGNSTTVTIDRVRYEDAMLFSAMYGWKLGDNMAIRAGLIDSHAGAGLDYDFLDDRVSLTAEVYDFNRPGELDAHLRLTGRYHLGKGLYVTGGYDDPLVETNRSWFVGGGLHWRDEDLKYLLGTAMSFAK